MLKKVLIIISLSFLFSQDQSITNVTVGQLTDGSGLIQVSYDLIDEVGTFASFNVEIQVSIDGSEFEVYSGSEVSGDVGENVIPGLGRVIYIQAPDETYSSNVVVKIIASAYTVTSELPFTMITISSIEGVSSYQDESISYSYDIMQNEMTNAELVTFLETYDFQLDADDAPTYNCNEYTEYYNTGMDGGCEDCVYGCTEEGAMNYNPDANVHTECIYEHQVGCTDANASNYYDDSGVEYEDCSCYLIDENSYWWYEQSDGEEYSCNWFSWSSGMWQGNTEDFPMLNLINVYGNGDLDNGASQLILNNLCNNGAADNYPSELVDELNSINQMFIDSGLTEQSELFTSCYSFPSSGSCSFDCDTSYLDSPDGTDDTDYGSVNIEDFSTQAISFEGSSFVIESGLGTQPAIFNYENCVDGVVVGLLIDHYGLRIPTGGEWTKAARENNERCWPWLESDCDAAVETYCNTIYECMSDEEFEACEEDASDLTLECQTTCNSDSSSCMQGCQGDGGDGGDVDCGSIFFDNTCENTEGCIWDEDVGYCLDECYDCMMDSDNAAFCSSNPCAFGCPCCDLCDDGGDSYDWECNEDCNNDMMSCMNDCGDGNAWNYCNGQDVQDCNNCMMNSQNCEGVDVYNLAEFLDEDNYDDDDGDGVYTSDYDFYGFYRDLFLNKFHYYYDSDSGSSAESIDLSDIAQYPNGISPFGLYDMIGNAPEVVKYNNNLWLVGIHPRQEYIGSFCANNGSMFDEDDYNIHAVGLSIGHGSYYNLYGLRLARTTQ